MINHASGSGAHDFVGPGDVTLEEGKNHGETWWLKPNTDFGGPAEYFRALAKFHVLAIE